MSKNTNEIFANEMKKIKENHLYREIRNFQSASDCRVKLADKEYIMLSSNNYLGFNNNPILKQAVIAAIEEFGVGSGGSRLTTGSTIITEKLEKQIANFEHYEDCIVYQTGYMANVGTISAICDKNSVIFSDELNHASIIDGCRLSGAKVVLFKHNDMSDLQKQISENPTNKALIVADGVFSMDGDIAPVPELSKIAKENGFLLMIDEAHSTGVLGENGRGTCEYFQLKPEEKPDILLGTLSKAIGGEGGFVCGSKDLVTFLRHKARSYVFSTAMSPATAMTAYKAFDLLTNENIYTKKLQDNIKFFCNKLNANGVEANSETAIIPIMIGSEQRAMNIMEHLLAESVFITAIRYPTVAKNSARLRVTLSAYHSQEDLQYAAKKIAYALEKF